MGIVFLLCMLLIMAVFFLCIRKEKTIARLIISLCLFLVFAKAVYSIPSIIKENMHKNYSTLKAHINEPFDIIKQEKESVLAAKQNYVVNTPSGTYVIGIANGKIAYEKKVIP